MLNFSEIGSRRNRTENLWNKVLKFEKTVENDLKLMKEKNDDLDELWEQVKQKIDLMEKQLKQKDIIIENQKGKISAIEKEIAIIPNFRKTGDRKTCF